MNTTTVLLIIHGLLAVALLGAVTHQTLSAWAPARKPAGSFVGRFRAVPGAPYAGAIVVLYVLTFLLGGIIYAEYRIEVRTVVEQLGLWTQNGSFELKEHFAAVGLAILPAYWYYWRQPVSGKDARTRDLLTALLAFIVWWNFLVGHILNNIRGFGS
jgi:ABC-type amino acid transport system permease subunit